MSTAGVAGFSAAEAVKNLRRSRGDVEWLGSHRDELRKAHPNMFIAIYERKVVGVSEALADMRRRVREAGIDPSKCVTDVMLTEDLIWVL